jgi:hypothetical protein
VEARSVREASEKAHLPVEFEPVGPVCFPLKESGVDWLTVTCSEPDRMDEFEQIACALLHVENSNGTEASPWRFAGFEGLRAGGIGFGRQQGMALMRLSGPTAWSYWRRPFELATNCSRIDLQITVADVPDCSALIYTHLIEAMDSAEQKKRAGNVELRMSNNSSPTLYLNKRISDRFGRCYDKGTQSKLDHYKGCVRYELQLNNETANIGGIELARARSPHDVAAGLVAGFFLKAGVQPRARLDSPSPLRTPRSRSNDDRRLSWLDRQCRPAVQDLIARGRAEDVIRVLGLSAFLTIPEHGPLGPKS